MASINIIYVYTIPQKMSNDVENFKVNFSIHSSDHISITMHKFLAAPYSGDHTLGHRVGLLAETSFPFRFRWIRGGG